MPLTRISLSDLRDEGFLLEANRLFFHPLGLALTVSIADSEGEGDELFVQDWRDVDYEGGLFDDLSDDDALVKSLAVAAVADAQVDRTAVLALEFDCEPERHGYLLVQPIGSKVNPAEPIVQAR